MITRYASVLGGLVLALSMAMGKPIDLMLGARPHAMGGAYVAIANDVNATYWNPAGMAQLPGMAFGASNQINQELLNVNINLVNGVIPIKGVGAVGYNWQMILAGLEQGNPNNAVEHMTDHWREHMFSLSFGRQLWDTLGVLLNTSVGINLNRYTYNTSEYHGAGLGFDVGVLTRFPYDIRLGLVARSLAADIEGEMFSPEYRIGLGYVKTFNKMHTLSVGSDVLLKKDVEYSDQETLDPVGMNIKLFEGFEYAVLISDFTAALRAGCNFALLHDREKPGLNTTYGLGLKYTHYCLDYTLTYNTAPEFSLGMTHHIALSFTAK